VARRSRRRGGEREAPPSTPYSDGEGNVLTLRDSLSPGTVHEYEQLRHRPAASGEDRWQREAEFLFERLAVSWTLAGLEPLTKPKELLARYRMAGTQERRWIRETIASHLRRNQPEIEV